MLQDEQNQGLAMINALTDAQRAKAIIHMSKTGNNIMAQAFKDNLVLEYVGIRASELAAEQQMQLLALIHAYVRNMDDGHATVKMAEVERHLDHTHFAWIGGTEPTSVFYYRIQSPVLLIEFDHQLPVGLRHLASDPQVVIASTSTPSCARQTAMTTARICCGSITNSIPTPTITEGGARVSHTPHQGLQAQREAAKPREEDIMHRVEPYGRFHCPLREERRGVDCWGASPCRWPIVRLRRLGLHG